MGGCINNLDGKQLILYDGDLVSAKLFDLDLRRADLRGLILEGAHFDSSD